MLRRIAFGLAMVAAMLASGGCLLRASEGAEPTAIPQLLPSPTPMPTSTDTPGPTPEPEIFVVTATPDPLQEVLIESTVVAQLSDPTIDPIILGVTQTFAAATQNALNLTATAESDFIVPTATFTLDPTFELFPTATATQASIGTGADCEHVVTAGQNLFRIGLQYNMAYQDIAAYNGIANANLISIGQRITIPNCGGGGGGFNSPSTESGDTGGTGGSVDLSGSTCGPEMVVNQGDTLYGISLRCNVMIRTIMSLNGISNPDLIYFNQTLRLQ